MPSTLLLVDVQRNMLEPPEPVPDAPAVASVIETVLGGARSAKAVVIHIRNNGGPDDPDAPGTPGWELAHEVLPGEHIVDKDDESAFDGTGLAELIPAGGDLVIVGLQSEYCVRATALAARERGYAVSLVRGAHATYDDEVPASETSRKVEQELTAAGVSVVDPAAVAFP